MPENNIKLLVVDDEEQFLKTLSRRLEMRGFSVTKATSGDKAVENAENQKFDLALLDLKMPGMDGKQLLGILKKKHKFLEIIILTGHGSLDSAVECTKLGAFGYLPKPYDLDQLVELLKKAYQQRLEKKFKSDEEKMKKIMQIATGDSALGIMRRLRELDDEEK